MVEIQKVSLLLEVVRMRKGIWWLSGSNQEGLRPVGGGQNKEGDMVVLWFPSCYGRSSQGGEHGGSVVQIWEVPVL